MREARHHPGERVYVEPEISPNGNSPNGENPNRKCPIVVHSYGKSPYRKSTDKEGPKVKSPCRKVLMEKVLL